MATPDLKMPSLDANAVVAIIEANWVRWGWDEKHTKTMIGKLSRGSSEIAPLDAGAATAILSMTREGWGLYNALKRTGITQRRFFAWILQSHSVDPADEPYRDFRLRLTAVFDDFTAKTGQRDEAMRRWLACLGR